MLDGFDLWVSIRNLSQSNTLLTNQISRALTPANNVPFNDEIRVAFNGGWKANEGDILQAVATYKVTAGANTAYSEDESTRFIVSG